MKKLINNNHLTATLLVLFLAIYACFIGQKIIVNPTPFIDWDESIYMQVGKEMITNKSIEPTWKGEPWLEKPFLLPFVYAVVGSVSKTPEITTRLFSLTAAIAVLFLTYIWAKRVFAAHTNDNNASWLGFTTVIILATNPLFLVRTQTVNTDVWLLLAWLGYILTYPHFGKSLVFLLLGVYSKSLLGFYPLGITILTKAIGWLRKEDTITKQTLQYFAAQIGVASIWYVAMYIIYRDTFIQVHFVDHLLRRVTQSVESHFGQRTYYLDLLVEQYSFFLIIAAISLVLGLYFWWNRKLSTNQARVAFFIVPFFAFLNLTKTKIEWYAYPTLAQTALLLTYPYSFLKKRMLIMMASIAIITGSLYYAIVVQAAFDATYSSKNPRYLAVMHAKKECKSLFVLLDPTTRETRNTLRSLGLLLSKTDSYGSYPSMTYYYGETIQTSYDADELDSYGWIQGGCVLIDETDESELTNIVDTYETVEVYDSLKLLKKI